MRHTQAQKVAEEFIKLIEDATPDIVVCGSLRRGNGIVKDIDIVAEGTDTLRVCLDDLLANHKIQQARYGQRRTRRWGQWLRSIYFREITIELNMHRVTNRGYKMWLHTGPGEANKAMMTFLKMANAPVKFDEGQMYWLDQPLSITDESSFFDLLGIPWIEPAKREPRYYRYHIFHPEHRYGDWKAYALPPPPKQLGLFSGF